MKPRNFPTRKLQRQIRAKLRAGVEVLEREKKILLVPRDIRFRVGATARQEQV